MVHRRQLPSPYCKMMLPRCKRKPNKLPILQNLCLCLAECRHSTNRYTAALFQRSLTIRYQFSPPRPGLCFTTRKTTTSGSPFSTTTHVILHDALDDAIEKIPRPRQVDETLARRVVNPTMYSSDPQTTPVQTACSNMHTR